MKLMRTEDAVGQVICHDITQIIKDVKKDAVFRKGHIITEEDIPVLLSVGKDHIYVWENDETMMHENEAAEVLCAICKGDNMSRGGVKEGKIELAAECGGVLRIDREKLMAVNSFGQMMIATRHGDFPVKKGDKLAGTRIIPLVIEKEKMERVKSVAGEEPIMRVEPYIFRKAGIVSTGNEVFYGRIKDEFTPVVKAKLKEYGAEVTGIRVSDDNNENIEKCIRAFLDEGCDLVVCTGGMSVDPDDRTPLAIRNVCGGAVTYGAPVHVHARILRREQHPCHGPSGLCNVCPQDNIRYRAPKSNDRRDTGKERLRHAWRGRPLSQLRGLHFPELRIR